MWSPDGAEFSKYPASTFLIASWHELFHAFTPDSNQPRLHNAASLIDELADISGRCQRDHRFASHVKRIQKELERALAEEDEILSKLPEYRSRAHFVVSEEAPLGVLTACQILSEHRGEYDRALVESAHEAIERLPKQKKRAHKSIRRLATLAVQHGREDDDVWAPFRKEPSRCPVELFEEIVELSTAKSKRYKCTVAVIGSPPEIQSTLRKAGFSPVSKSKLPSSYLSEIAESHERLMFVEREIDAASIRNAVSTSRKQLGSLQDW